MMTREMNAYFTPPPVPAKMKQGVKLRKSVVELVETEKTYIKVVFYDFFIFSINAIDVFRIIFIRVYCYGHPNCGTQKKKYTFLYNNIPYYRLCFLFLTLASKQTI